ncbi:MAG: hypothetical protein JNJ54_01890 [Myxococcaceae bacterium]|nr:hypothetical protein [Myxococcaceae bacterium]
MAGVLVAMMLMASPADRLAPARAAFDELQYEQVLAVLPPAAEWQGFTRAEVAQALSLRALALASVKRDAEALLTFKQLLSLEPSYVLPEQFGPRVRTMFLEAKDAAARAGVVALTEEKGALVMGSAGFGIVEEVSVSWRADGAAGNVAVAPAPRIEPPWPSVGRVEAWGALLGPGKSVLATWGSAEKPFLFGVVTQSPRPVTEPAARPLRALGVAGLVTGAVGLVGLGLGAIFLVDSNRPVQVLATAMRDATNRVTSPTQREAFELDAAAQRSYQLGGVLLGVGAVAAAAGVTLFVLDRVLVVPHPGGVGVLVPFDALFAPAVQGVP